jgi:hypothetical protein
MMIWKRLLVVAMASAVLAACGNDGTTTADETEAPETDTVEDPAVEDLETEEQAADTEEVEGGDATEEPAPADEGDLALGESARVGDYEVTVTAFTADATDEVLTDNEFNEEPSNGVYATATFDATYLGDDEGTPGFDLSAALVIDGVQHADYECNAYVDGDAIEAPTLENGGSVSGLVFCFDHPGVNDDARLFFEETISFEGERAYWAIP